jgi:hypothetical protein
LCPCWPGSLHPRRFPAPPTDEEERPGTWLCSFSARDPRWGWRKAAACARKAGYLANRKRVQRLWRDSADYRCPDGEPSSLRYSQLEVKARHRDLPAVPQDQLEVVPRSSVLFMRRVQAGRASSCELLDEDARIGTISCVGCPAAHPGDELPQSDAFSGTVPGSARSRDRRF